MQRVGKGVISVATGTFYGCSLVVLFTLHGDSSGCSLGGSPPLLPLSFSETKEKGGCTTHYQNDTCAAQTADVNQMLHLARRFCIWPPCFLFPNDTI